MTLSDFQRARLAEFAAREAGPRGSLEEMRGIAVCLMNRAKAGWHDGNLLAVIENAIQHAAHEDSQMTLLDPDSRVLQRLLTEIEDLFYGSAVTVTSGEGMGLVESLSEKKRERKYWCYLNRPIRPWFQQNVLSDKNRSRTTLGTLMFLE